MSQPDVAATQIERRALLAAGVTVLLWASAFVAIREAAPHFSPGALALGRMLIGSTILSGIMLARGVGLPPRPAWPGIIGSGVLWFGLYMVSLNWGEQRVDAGTASMVAGVGPILVAVLGGLLLKEGFPARLVTGVATAFIGTVIVGVSKSGGGSAPLLGVLACLLAAACYAAGVVLQKPALRHASALQATTFGCLTATVACLPFAGQLVSEVGRAPYLATLNIVYLGVFPTAVAFTTWAYALARGTAGRTSATVYVVPALVVLMSWLLLGEVPGWLTYAGGVLCLAGVAISRRRGRWGLRRALAPEAPITAR